MALSFHDAAAEGDLVILFSNLDSMSTATLKAGGATNTKFGSFRHGDMIGAPFGSKISSRDARGWIIMLRPSPDLITESLVHRTQILYHADIAMIIGLLDLMPGRIVLESGTGSGSLTSHLIHAVAPTGHVHTCEFHEKRWQQAKEEFEGYGLSSCVTCHWRDVCSDGFPPALSEEGPKADACFLDLPSPWEALGAADKCLKAGGKIVNFSPCIEQVARVCTNLETLGYQDIRTLECLTKGWGVRYDLAKRPGGVAAEGKDRTRVGRQPVGEMEASPSVSVPPSSAACPGESVEDPGALKRKRGGVAEEAGEPKAESLLPELIPDSLHSYQLPMKGHTGYLTVASKPPHGDRTMPL
uniref:tRNA (adenine(58)-N(1))-methyltransferase n=1 Tax=Chromera velia CCMP2878 TaxID=1169474 RepID=A0A0G4H8X9_9ALVE|mmetsp:Transcript_8517/g.16646  ORF Transcript_8517/g.16646 Transcript_8517/m.16646 type:complete len:356 (-) Transcript_8517:119-1186(-)|eukprot:Cvel_25161.t1-p1 / transcript=Cvel_25161.t1 / gene=Cvel_25161 / organism=Chromera_velia_CCMP2878 / gene_product=tRNA (adenine(58)-N(1))-methyltransferase catalytic, putative / transcript_product=tRNA (adenine(58)-N(1))-methyltransferase catalytic, putative / location=Cvel_scaffold2815:8517-14592(+) / protein_length=355 / sequence_SO=supercontig / SO=protein_coding / is_pseudo=false